MIYTNTYKCGCRVIEKTTCPPDTPSSSGNNCLIVCHILVPSAESINPCGFSGHVDISDKYFLQNGFEGVPLITILQHTENLVNVSYLNDKIYFTSNYTEGSDLSYKFAEIYWKIKAGKLSNIGKIVIIFKQIAGTTSCDSGYTYNPCTGDCDDATTDLATDISSTSDNNTDLNAGTPSVTF